MKSLNHISGGSQCQRGHRIEFVYPVKQVCFDGISKNYYSIISLSKCKVEHFEDEFGSVKTMKCMFSCPLSYFLWHFSFGRFNVTGFIYWLFRLMLKTTEGFPMTSRMSFSALRVQCTISLGSFVCFCGPRPLTSVTGMLLPKGNLTWGQSLRFMGQMILSSGTSLLLAKRTIFWILVKH